MRYIYTAVFYLLLPFVLFRAVWRARNAKGHPQRWTERLGFYSKPRESASLWIHAVSYGEAVAAEPLLKALKLVYPMTKIIVTTMTLTGALRVAATWKGDKQVEHFYVPYDIPFAIKRFLKHIKPRIGIIIETELWPNLLYIAGKRQIPLLLANARLSPRSHKGYKKLRKFFAPLLKNLTCVGAQSEKDAQRFIAIGTPKPQVVTLGNIKFDIKPPIIQIANGRKHKETLPFEQIIVAASTHEDEESRLLALYDKIKAAFPLALLIIVPRHPERFDNVATLCAKKGHRLSRRSIHAEPQPDSTIFLGDSMGELYYFYSLADIAFVGGSLVPIGGHNLLEPAALKLPIVTGPHLFNFSEISQLLKNTGTLHVGVDEEALFPIFTKLLNDKAYRVKVGEAGFKVLEENQGATDRHLSMVAELLQDPRN